MICFSIKIKFISHYCSRKIRLKAIIYIYIYIFFFFLSKLFSFCFIDKTEKEFMESKYLVYILVLSFLLLHANAGNSLI